METSIKLDTDRWFEIRTTEEVSLDWRNKFNAPINRRRIIVWTQDNHVRTNLLVKEGQYFLEMCYKTEECRKTTVSSLQKIFHDLVDFVNNLPEVDSTIEDDKIKDDKIEDDNDYQLFPHSHLEKNRKFVQKVLDKWEETDDRLGICGAVIFGEDSTLKFAVPCGHIEKSLLKQMFETWLEKYGNK